MYKFIKRFLDIICALLGIIGTSPLWIIAIVGILVSDWGPVFYTSTRIGKGNKPFRMFKFRSMREDKNANEASLRPDEDRIFAFGKFIRKLKIDELPQLLNILNGTMSVVGPRPVAKDQMDLFRVGKWNLAAEVAVGLSGPAALYDFIYGDQFEDPEEYMEKVFQTRRELEYVYVKKMSFGYDVKMVVYTIICIFYALFGKECTWMLKEFVDAAKESEKE
jgi:lipopolysaccharide/colanic/teichoic acid biosynthesis glycosyltransferase